MEGTASAGHSPFDLLPGKVEELLHSLSTLNVNGEAYGSTQFVLTNYIFFMILALILMGVVVFFAVKKLSLVPKSRLSNGVEALTEFIRNDIAASQIGHGSDKYFPFLATVFFFILFNNILGLIPGFKPGTGTMGVTVALSTVVFGVFNTVGVKEQGFIGYMKSFAPKGVFFPINILVWAIEVLSAFLRVLTLSVRLYANMYAGHIILGIFAILTALFTEPLILAIETGSGLGGATVGAVPTILWIVLMTALYAMEVLVAVLQAYVFTLLSAVYIGMAAHEH
ncbi:MAG: F0F1 ATP synthase subunit A [Coriobacteriia bacterium]|nr:F0F1 ATP synthase subunit A [Coriobacteriia bacterium]